MKPIALFIGLTFAALVAGCGGDSDSATPTGAATAVPTAVPQTGGSASGTVLTSRADVVAQNLQFSPPSLTVRAGAVSVALENRDQQVPHDIRVEGFPGAPTCTGPCETSTSFNAGPGTYRFACTVHPEMTGMLTLVP